MNYTSIEQSKKLLELGLNPETADMCYPRDAFATNYDEEPVCHPSGVGLAHPCWSLSALLELMPDGTSIFYRRTHTTIDMVGVNNGIVRNKHREKGSTPFEAFYSMIVWLLENGYIKTEKK